MYVGPGAVLDFLQLFVGGPISPVWHVPGGGDSVPILRIPRKQMRCRPALLLALACGLAPVAAYGQVEGFQFTREVAVPNPGWV